MRIKSDCIPYHLAVEKLEVELLVERLWKLVAHLEHLAQWLQPQVRLYCGYLDPVQHTHPTNFNTKSVTNIQFHIYQLLSKHLKAVAYSLTLAKMVKWYMDLISKSNGPNKMMVPSVVCGETIFWRIANNGDPWSSRITSFEWSGFFRAIT